MIIDPTFLFNSVAIFVTLFMFNFIGATTGGSALLTIPTCIFFGFTPVQAIATMRFGMLGSSLAGWCGFKKEKKVNYRIGIVGALFACIGAIWGAYYLVSLPTHLIQHWLGVVMLFVVALMLLQKQAWALKLPLFPKPLKLILGYTFLTAAGFLSGMFGGQGVLFNIILISAFNQTFLEAAGTRSVINLFVAVTSIIVYYETNVIHWAYAGTVLIAMAAGTYFGALYGLKKGDKWVEKLFMFIAVLIALYFILS